MPALVGDGGPRRSRFTAAAFFVALQAAALSYRLPGSSWLDLLAGSMAGAVLYSVTLEWLTELELRRDRPAAASRRAALGWLVLTAGGLLDAVGIRMRPSGPGNHRIVCRATDGEGRVQDAALRPPHPSGSTGYHQVRLRAA